MNIHDVIKKTILSNLKNPSDCKIGIEIENIIYTDDGKRIKINPCDSFSASDLLKTVKKSQETKGNYSLEPGGQLEWASPPFKNLNDLENAIQQQVKHLINILNQKNLKVVTEGLDPHFLPKEVDLINQRRYKIMDKNMLSNGSMGQWMMRCTSSIQVNFDASSMEEMQEMVFIADCLHPISAYLFSNSPYKNKKPAKKRNFRNIIWANTDDVRCNNLFDHGIYSKNNLIDNYINYFLNSPAIFSLDRNGKAIFTKNTFGDILKKMKKNGTLSKKYILELLRQIFTNVRIKDLVEIRGADRTPEGFEIAPAAFWTGLLTEKYVRDIVIETTSHWTKQDRLFLNNSALSLNKDQKGPSKKKYGDWIDYFSELALEGLRRRQFGEEHLLEDYLKIVKEKGPFTLQKQKDG